MPWLRVAEADSLSSSDVSLPHSLIPPPLLCPPHLLAPARLVEEHPDRAVSWFAVGCYYMCARQHEQARRYFGKATGLDRCFAPAWVAFGHAFAAQDESDQVRLAGLLLKLYFNTGSPLQTTQSMRFPFPRSLPCPAF